ncbi:MAG: hypothetical protein EA370_05475 [Wenzhouxiangella sp.]|nr:MAG: hypothetical protein EA370_05475 [Wenzhouxiangella sp.]
MRLRTQLLLLSLVLLVLPLAAWQFARQVEQTLRDGHARGLLDSARAAAQVIASETAPLLPEPAPVLYVHAPERSPYLDGYADDWSQWQSDRQSFASADGQLQVAFSAAADSDGLYLLLEVHNREQVFSDPVRGHGDHVELRLVSAEGQESAVRIAPLAPGWIEARGNAAGGWPRIQGYWQPRGDGWTLELQLPDQRRPRALGFQVHDSDRNGHGRIARSAGPAEISKLIQRIPALDHALARLTPADTRAWLSLDDGWVLAAADRHLPRPSGSALASRDASWLSTLAFEALLSGRLATGQQRRANTARLIGPDIGVSETAVRWHTRAGDPGIELTVSAPVIVDAQRLGAVVMSRSADDLLEESTRAATRLLLSSLLVLALIAAVLLGFATLLSERIRRLSDLAEAAVGADGRVVNLLTAPRARDEIGDLGRSVAALLQRLNEHQNYLRTLADKLAHELRTPLAMIRSSLDNLEHSRDPEDIARYCRRANEGSARLNRIFQAMSQAARIEDSIRGEPARPFDLHRLLSEYVAACRNTYTDRRFELALAEPGPVTVHGSADLFAQLLDKLVDNAVDFSPEDGRIGISLKRRNGRLTLRVENQGPPLPDGMAETLFDSMVSRRQGRSDNVHLGLGLHIARLIADYHGGRIRAFSTDDGVCVELGLASVKGER